MVKRRYTFKKRIPWGELKKNKSLIKKYKEKYGTRRAVYCAEGILGLRRGEFMRYRPRILNFIRKL